ncbi:transcription factor VBP-like [Lytechinus pictus]|uniref:transcription factor VBP-like n=1 Tax=Lytechinus pictus TaxID=7653 RepID=UPI0030B9E853
MESKEVIEVKMTKPDKSDSFEVITPIKHEKMKKSALDVSNMVGPSRPKSATSSDVSQPESGGKPLDLTYSAIVSASQLKGVYPYSAMLPAAAAAAVSGYSYSEPTLAASAVASYAGYPALINYPVAENSGATSQSLSSLRLSALLASRRRRAATAVDVKPEEPSRKKVKPVPDEKKDIAYWERRRKNNDAAKRSRDARRMKEEEIAIRAVYLEQDNMKLRAEVSILKSELARLHYMVYNC